MNPLLIRRRGMMGSQSVAPHDGQLEWIETDGVAYIDSGVKGMQSFAAEAKIYPKQVPSGIVSIIGTETANSMDGANRLIPFIINEVSKACFARYYFYSSGMRDISPAITNETYYIQRSQLRSGSQLISTKLYGESTFTTVTKAGTGIVGSSYNMYIFAANRAGTAVEKCPNGTKIGYLTIWDNYDMTSTLKTFIPWRLNGEVGLMDTLTNTFHGNAAGSGAFTGGPNVI